MVEIDSNAILVETTKSRKDEEMICAYNALLLRNSMERKCETSTPKYTVEWLGYDQPSFFADTFCVLSELDFQSFINDCVALEAMFEFCIRFLGFSNF